MTKRAVRFAVLSLIAIAAAFSPRPSVRAEEGSQARPPLGFAAGVAHGLLPAAAGITTRPGGTYGDKEYWDQDVKVYRDMGNAWAGALEKLAGKLDEIYLSSELKALAKDLKSAPQSLPGDLEGNIGAAINQENIFKRVGERVAKLAAATAKTPASDSRDAKTYEQGLAQGLSASSAILLAKSARRGDTQTSIGHFLIRREMGNAAAKSLSGLAKTTQNGMLVFTLEQLSADLDSADQGGGYHDADGWKEKTKYNDNLYERVGDRLQLLADPQ